VRARPAAARAARKHSGGRGGQRRLVLAGALGRVLRGTLFQRLRLDGPPGGEVARKLYIRCTDPPLVYMRKFYDWASISPGWQITELATGHDAMVTEPETVARVLTDWAAG
jgi:hypothetical protein